jgi:diguanylate cyclase (GGDEF)-like protein
MFKLDDGDRGELRPRALSNTGRAGRPSAYRCYARSAVAQRSPNARDFPHSPYAAELTQGVRRLRFSAPLEAEYLHHHLGRTRARIRVWCSISLLIALGFALPDATSGAPLTLAAAVHAASIVLLWALLAGIAFTSRYEALYGRIAPIAVALVSILITSFIAQRVAAGKVEELVLVSIQLFAVFFFLGLFIRQATLGGALIVASFAISAWWFGAAAGHTVRATAFLAIAAWVAAFVGMDKERAYRRNFLERALIAELLERDALTGLKNRRAFDEHLLRIWQQAQRVRCHLGILMIDVDYFKAYNDAEGHQAGDEALRRVAQVIREFGRRPLDWVGRYGGEEFALLLFDLPPAAISEIAQRVCLGMADARVPHGASSISEYVTLSIGVAIVQPRVGRSPEGAVQLADEALYEAKAQGRNRVSIRGEDAYASAKTGAFKRFSIVGHKS